MAQDTKSPQSYRPAIAGDRLSRENARIDMICTDLDGDRLVIDRLIDHKRAEVGVWSGGSFGFYGDRVRYDELTFTGEMYFAPNAIPNPEHPENQPQKELLQWKSLPSS